MWRYDAVKMRVCTESGKFPREQQRPTRWFPSPRAINTFFVDVTQSARKDRLT